MGSEPPTILLRDGDGKFGGEFNQALRSRGCSPKQLPPCSPQLNAFAERWVRSVKSECLDHFMVFGEAHLNHLVKEYVEHFHCERPHQGLGNRIPHGSRAPPPDTGRVVWRTRGGVLRHYFKTAA